MTAIALEMEDKKALANEEKETNFGDPDTKDDEKKEAPPKVNYLSLYRFATGSDIMLIIFGWLAAVVVGVSQPLLMIIFGGAVDDFTSSGKFSYCDTNNTDVYNTGICAITLEYLTDEEQEMIEQALNSTDNGSTILNSMTDNVYWFIGIGVVTWICGYIQTACLMISAQRQVIQLRSTYFRAIIRQDIGYFDTHDTGELNTRMFDDVKKIQDGIAEKVGVAIQSIAQFVGGLIIGFIYGWKMALVILAIIPVLSVSGYLWFYVTTAYTKGELDAYAIAGGIAEEVISGIRTVTAFTGQKEEVLRYSKPLAVAEQAGIKKYALTGAAIGLLYFTMFCSYGLAFWYGSKLIIEEDYTVGQKLIVFFGVILGSFGLSQFGQNAEYLATAQTAAHTVYEIIDRVPIIDTQSDKGKMIETLDGLVEFKNVDFTYPARMDQKILKNVSFKVEAGKTTAFCGQSGCGKSTCFQLLKRFYDTEQGTVLIDGIDIKEFNVRSLRSVIGVVSQEPLLFDTTIEENIRYGNLDVTKEEIYTATKQANAYDFIMKLPETWNTHVGEGGATLSGGQKQRIAIARALVRNPKILLLDEATSALDTESEAIVQKALENASKGRTTIVIAHRLSTIRNADKIIGFHQGEVVEEGTHQTLMETEKGVYFNLCNMQTFAKEETEEGEEQSKVTVTEKEIIFKETKQNIKTEDKTEEEPEEEITKVPYSQLLKWNSQEWPLMTGGAILSLATGAIQPIWALVFAEVLALYGEYNCAYNKEIQAAEGMFESSFFQNETFNATQIKYDNEECSLGKFKDQIAFLSAMFCVLGVANFIGFFGSVTLFGMSGEKLTTRLRKMSFEKLLQLEIGYFDDPMNSTGALAVRLASDASKVQGATGARINVMVQNVGAFVCGFTIAFYYSWMLTLVCLAFVPFIIITTALMMAIFTGEIGDEEQKAVEHAGKIATEATINIRTVASLGREDAFATKYEENMTKPLEGKTVKINLYGFMYGASLGIIFMMYAGVFYFAAWMISTNKLPSSDFADIFKVLFAIMFAAMTAGQSGSMAPDYGEATKAAGRIFKLLSRESEINPDNEGGKKPTACLGEITFEDVEFHYPTRPDVKVLKGLNITVKPGETLALVGQSGCGKSTCIQLLERFYDGSAGNVMIDGERISELNVKWLRQQIGLVQQEPILFDKTIKENILYGLELNNGGTHNEAFSQNGTNEKNNKVGIKEDDSTMEDKMRSASKEANAFHFIEELPAKFETGCGKKGSQLSGGQKQRIAIARALVRQPKILLLDEATSALDAESEKLVQDALNKAQEGRTVILIAHRLSTVINANKIAVIDNGRVSEIGTHTELLNKKGAYYSLINSQL